MVRIDLRPICLIALASGCFLPRGVGSESDGGAGELDARVRRDSQVPPPDAPVRTDSPTCVPSAEICDGEDNNCNDAIDEDVVVEPCDTDDFDLCQDDATCMGGARVCVEGGDHDLETCNGMDDDCDGDIDGTAVCECDLRTFGGHNYYFCNFDRDFDEAGQQCPLGYTLVKVDNSEEQDFLQDAALDIQDTAWWLGATDADTDALRWVLDGTAVPDSSPPGYENWGGGQPNEGGTACIVMDAGDGAWYDVRCTDNNRFICESRDP
jgi:hypothetical protein